MTVSKNVLNGVGTYNTASWVLDFHKKSRNRTKNFVNAVALRDACGNGHKYVEGSFSIKVEKRGGTSRVCLICKRDRQAIYDRNEEAKARSNFLRRQVRHAAKLGIPVAEYRKQFNTDMARKDQFENFNYTLDKGKLRDDLDLALDAARHNGQPIPCEADPDAYFDIQVSASKAEEMCSGCPFSVREACYAFGKTERVDDPETQQVIYGGKRFLGGVEVR